jgi:mono/diheme cytochrome c family protein
LTSGIGGIAKSYSDADWVRAIRHGVRPDNRVEIFMYEYFSTISDQDLGALIAFLKQIPPVDSDVREMHYGPVLAVAPAVGLFTPMAELIDHKAPRPADPQPGATIEYGKYLSPICIECHGTYVAGKLERWTQDEFLHTIQTGVKPDGNKLGQTMSSKSFSEMNAEELTALWQYFMSLKP